MAGELDDGVEPLVAERVRALPAVQRHAVAEHELLGLGPVPGKCEMRHSVCFVREVVNPDVRLVFCPICISHVETLSHNPGARLITEPCMHMVVFNNLVDSKAYVVAHPFAQIMGNELETWHRCKAQPPMKARSLILLDFAAGD